MNKIVEYKEYLLVQLPEGTNDYFLGGGDTPFTNMLNEVFLCTRDGKGGENIGLGTEGEVQIIGLGHQLKDSDWEGIVGEPPYVDYGDKNLLDPNYKGLWAATPTASGLSLLASHDMKAETTLILKK